MISEFLDRLDAWIEGLSGGASVVALLAIAALLGLRHATDLDHVTAVTSLAAAKGRKAAGKIGLWWGAGHATTVTLFGLLVILTGSFLPEKAYQAAEVTIGFIIMGLALWLLMRWHKGEFRVHSHRHDHDGSVHRHYHVHSGDTSHAAHEIRARTPKQAYGIGLIHGLGGSAGASLLIITLFPNKFIAVGALLLFNVCTMISMGVVSSSYGFLLTRPKVQRTFAFTIPILALLSLAFGAVYTAGGLGWTQFSV